MVPILKKTDPILRKVAQDVALKDIGSKKIQKVIEDMKEALAGEDDGVAIAAPQIGESLRIFIVSGKMLRATRSLGDSTSAPTETTKNADLVFINPVITKLSKEKKAVPEGCLSVRYLYGNVLRSTRASIKAYNEHGQLFERGGSGLLAQIFQHETDHLNGILFIDKASELEEVLPEKKPEK